MFGMFWPFDFSFSGICMVGFLLLWWMSLSVVDVAKKATKVVKKVAQDETVQDVGKGFLQNWLESHLRR